MNDEKVKIAIGIMEAFIDGKELQYMNVGDDKWTDVPHPVFNFSYGEYRIKPKAMEFYAIANEDKTDILSTIYETREEAEEVARTFKAYSTIVHMREIE